MRTTTRLTIATALFAAAHSVLASRRAKQFATRLLGERLRNAWYRPFYLLQSAVTVGVLYAYARRLPDRTLYDLEGTPWKPLLQSVRVGALLYATWAAYEVGIEAILGIRSLRAWIADAPAVPPEPEAQGPSLAGSSLNLQGPFRASRHPLNLCPLPVLWLRPRMTRNLLVFNLLATLYLLAGSAHEESRLAAAYGNAYRRYQRSGIPFYLPRLGSCCTESGAAADL